MMTERMIARGEERLHAPDRRHLLRLLAGVALAMPALAIAGCADTSNGDGDGDGNRSSNWDPGWTRGKRGMSGDGSGGGGGAGDGGGPGNR